MADAASTTTSSPTPTSYIALTTVFTAPDRCSSSWTYEPSDFNANPSGLFIQNVMGGFDTACWPESFTHAGRNEVVGTVQIFSPGWCPDGYSTALLAPGDTTTVTCCPSSFRYLASSATNGERAGGGLAGCISTFSSDVTTTVLARPLSTLTPNNIIVTSTLTGADLGDVTMWAQPITIAYQQRDVSLFSTSSSAASSSAAASSSQNGTAAATTTSGAAATSSASSDQSSGLSTGAKAGIGVGVALGVLALLGVVLFLLFRRRKRQVEGGPSSYAHEAPAHYPAQEMDGESPRVEMASAQDPIAKTQPGKVHEMEGSRMHYA